MLTIRQKQVTVLNECMLERFIEKALTHLKEVFPDPSNEKGPEAMRKLVEAGIGRAADFGLTQEQEVMLFIDLIMALGQDFEHKPNHEWMRRTLQSGDLDQREKMELIYQRLDAQLKKSPDPSHH